MTDQELFEWNSRIHRMAARRVARKRRIKRKEAQAAKRAARVW